MVLTVRPTQNLMPNELAQTGLEADMTDQEWRNDDVIAGGPDRHTDRVIVGKFIGEVAEAADLFKHRSPHCDGGPEAGLRGLEGQSDNRLRQKMRVDGKRRHPRPQALAGNAVVQRCDRAGAWLRQQGGDIA